MRVLLHLVAAWNRGVPAPHNPHPRHSRICIERPETCRLELRRQQLAPEVAKWRRFGEQSERHRRRKARLGWGLGWLGSL